MKKRLAVFLSAALASRWLCAAADSGPTPPATRVNATAQPVILFVHGASGGGWQFKQVAALMEAKGWKTYRPSLSGLGEHYHTATTNIGLSTHIEDIVNFILFEDLRDVNLLGHSYAGLVIAGVTDRIPERIRHVIYLDAFVPLDGESLMTTQRPDAPDSIKNVKDGFLVRPTMKADAPPPRQVPQPFKTFTETISLKNPAAEKIPASVILTVAKGKRPEDDTFYFSTVRGRARGWPVHIIEGDHYPMLRQPEAMAGLLINIR